MQQPHDKRAMDAFLDNILDGKPVHVVETLELRRQLQERRMKRQALEWRKVWGLK